VFDALIDPLAFVVVLLVIAIVVIAARWGRALAPAPPEAARTEESEDRPPAGE